MRSILPYAISGFLLIAALFTSYQWGYTTRDKELASDKYNASLAAMEKIKNTFEEYEKLVSEIENTTDNNSVPPLIKSTIDRLPNSGKK